MGATKLNDAKLLRAEAMVSSGESIRSVARSLGITHGALAKRLRAISAPPSSGSAREPEAAQLPSYGAWGEFDETDVGIILAVADAGVPGGLTELARYMEAGLGDVLEVVREFGNGEEEAGTGDDCGD